MNKSLYVRSRPDFFVYFVVVVCDCTAILCIIKMTGAQSFQNSLGFAVLGILLALVGNVLLMQKTIIDERGIHVRTFNRRSLPLTWKTILWEDITALRASEPLQGPYYRGFNLVVRSTDDHEVLVDVFLYRNNQHHLAKVLIEQAWEHNKLLRMDQTVLAQYGRPPFGLGTITVGSGVLVAQKGNGWTRELADPYLNKEAS